MGARLGIVRAIVGKDLRAFARDRFYVLVSVMGLVFYVGVFWLLPATVDETVTVGVHLDRGAPLLVGFAGAADGVDVRAFASSEALTSAVREDDEVLAGLDFPPGFVDAVRGGEDVTVRVLLPGDAPDELRPALSGMVRELSFVVAGELPPVTAPDLDELVVGEDRAGAQVPLRERMRPLFVFLVLMVDMLALASLVAAEIHQRTITALLATPARVADVLAAKATLGTLLAFSQAVLLAVALGGLGTQAPLLLTALLLGAVLVTGVGLIAGASGGDFLRVVFVSVLLLVPLAVPAFTALVPGTTAGWVRALPTHGLVEVIVGASTYGQGWADAAGHLLALAAWCVVVLAIGSVLLARRAVRV